MENTEPQKASKNKKKPLIVIIALIIIVLIVGALVLRPDKKQTSNTTDKPEVAVVQITSTGFVPATISVSSGTVVKWQNTDTTPHQVGANPYPSHSDLPALNSKTILPGETYSFTFTKAGNYKYYDGNVLTSNGVVQVK